MARTIIQLDNYSARAKFLRLFRDTQSLSQATGFIWESNDQQFLITCWHVVTGLYPDTLKAIDQENAGTPTSIELLLRKLDDIELAWRVDLYDLNGDPLWWVHPLYDRQIDVVAIPISPPENVLRLNPINTLHETDLPLLVGMPVFVLGYPFPTEKKPEVYPVWKLGTVATEPDAALRGAAYMLIDTLSRPGMSGAPVIRREYGQALVETTRVDPTDDDSPMQYDLRNVGRGSKFIGVYSGRLRTENDKIEAQLGLVWRRHLLEEIVAGGKRDVYPHPALT
jgi:hypothetical protein